MLCSRLISSLCLVVGSMLPAAAAPQITGGGAGSWHELSQRSVLASAEMPSDVGETIYDLSLLLVGRENGQVFGEMRQRPIRGEPNPSVIDLVYTIQGHYTELEDGRVELQSDILLDLASFGLPGQILHVGEVVALLFPAQNVYGYCPVLPVPSVDSAEVLVVEDNAAPMRSPRSKYQAIDPEPLPLPLQRPPHGELIARWILY